jgi:hypothetical protein
MKRILYIAGLILVLFAGCKKEEEEPFFQYLIGIPNATVMGIQYVSNTSNELVIDMDVSVLTSNDRNVKWVEDSAFKPGTIPYLQYTIESVSQMQYPVRDNYSNLLIMDQSGNYDDFDPANQRLRALNKFFQDVNNDNRANTAFGYFSRSGNWTDDLFVYNEWANPFKYDYEVAVEQQFWMTFFEGGTSNLYDAINQSINYVDEFAPTDNKMVTAFVKDTDDGLGMYYKDVIANALQKNVKINIISIGAYSNDFFEMTYKTGGFLSIIDARTLGEVMDKGTTMLGGLNKLLLENLKVYQVRVKIKRLIGSYTSGSFVRDEMKVQEHLENGTEIIYNPLPIYFEIP